MLCFPFGASAKSKISISNLEVKIAQELKEHFQLQNNSEYSFAEIEEIMKWLHKKSNLDQVQVIRNEKNEIQFKIIPTTRIKSVTLQGAQSYSESEILSFFNVRVGDSLDTDTLLENGAKLQKFYQENGFNKAEVE